MGVRSPRLRKMPLPPRAGERTLDASCLSRRPGPLLLGRSDSWIGASSPRGSRLYRTGLVRLRGNALPPDFLPPGVHCAGATRCASHPKAAH